MRRDFDVWITNMLTSEIEVIHNVSAIYYSNKDLSSSIISFHILKYIDKAIPIKLEIVYK